MRTSLIMQKMSETGVDLIFAILRRCRISAALSAPTRNLKRTQLLGHTLVSCNIIRYLRSKTIHPIIGSSLSILTRNIIIFSFFKTDIPKLGEYLLTISSKSVHKSKKLTKPDRFQEYSA